MHRRCDDIARGPLVAGVLLSLGLIVGVGLAWYFGAAIGGMRGMPDRVYTIMHVRDGLRAHPSVWVGRTVRVRGMVLVLHCESRGCGGFPFGPLPSGTVPPLWVRPVAGDGDGVLDALRGLPLIGRLWPAPAPQVVVYGPHTYRLIILPLSGCHLGACSPGPRPGASPDALLPDASP